jgi:exopolyphosphatase/pppGpp-phosphohydrolase
MDASAGVMKARELGIKGRGSDERPRAVAKLVRKRLGQVRHERRVAALAVAIFRLLSPLHGLGRRERSLLELGALLHDIGRCRGARRHPVRGARLILKDQALPLTDLERRAVAYMARYHRGRARVNSGGRLAYPGDSQAGLRLLAMLRLADALDCRRAPLRSLAIRWRGNQLRVRCRVRPRHHSDVERKLHRSEGFRLLRQTMGLRVVTCVEDCPS